MAKMNRGVLVHVLGPASLEGTSIAEMAAAFALHAQAGDLAAELWFLSKPGPLVERFRAQGCTVRCIHWNGTARDFAGACDFVGSLKRSRVRLLHQHYGSKLVRLAGRLVGAQTVVHLHACEDEGSGKVLESISLPFADAVIATSRAVARCVKRGDVVVAYPFISDRMRSSIAQRTESSDCVIGAARRLARFKGLDDLIEAMVIVRQHFPRARLEIAGTGPMKCELDSLVESLSLGDAVTFLGWREDLAAVMSRWNLCVVPSREEGFGIAALEAMYLGIPVVATSAGGLPELIDDGTSGLLVPPRDPIAMAAAIGELLGSNALRARLGVSGREHAQRFCFDEANKIVEGVYRRVLRAAA